MSIPLSFLKNVIHQIDNKNKWLLHPASFTVKFGLVFALTLGNAFCQGFRFKANRKSIGSSKHLRTTASEIKNTCLDLLLLRTKSTF